MPSRPPPRAAVPASTTRPGRAAGRAPAAERRRSRYGASTSGSSSSRILTRGQRERLAAADPQRTPGVEVLDASRRTRTASGMPRTRAATRMHWRVSDARYRTRGHAGAADLGDPDRPPLAHRARRAGRERRAQDLQPEPLRRHRAREPRRRRPKPRRRGSDVLPSATSRTCVGRRTPGRRVERQPPDRDRPRRRPLQPGAAGRPATSRSTAVSVPSNALRGPELRAALEARRRTSNDAADAGEPVERRIRRVGARRSPSRRRATLRAAGGAKTRSRPRSPSSRSRTSMAPAEPRRGSRRNGSSPVVRWNRYVSPVRDRSRPASARSASTGARSASSARHARDLAARGCRPPRPSGRRAWCTAAIRTLSVRTPRRPTRSRFQPGLDGEAPALDLDRGHRPAAVVVREQVDRIDVARRVERHRRARGGRASARGRPASAWPGRRRAPRTAAAPGTAGSPATKARGHAVIPSKTATVCASLPRSANGFEHRRVDGRLLGRGQHRPGVLRQPRDDEHPPPVGVGDHDLRRARDRGGGRGRPRRRSVREVAEGRQPGDALGGAVDHHARLGAARDERGRARAGGPRPAPRAARRGAPSVPAARGDSRRAPHSASARAELVEHVGRLGGGRGAAAGAVVVGARPRPSARPAGRAAARAVRAPRGAAGRARRRSTAGRWRAGRRSRRRCGRPPGAPRAPAGSGRSSRPSRSTRRAGRAGRRPARRRRVDVTGGRPPGRRHVIPQQLVVERAAAWSAASRRRRRAR